MHRLLIVEDDVDLRQVLEHAFRSEGFRPAVTGLGAEALERIRREPPDLVLLDRILPDLPGTELCRRLKGDPATARLPVLMITARGELSDRIAGLEAGADDYLAKPFSLRELVLRVRALLRGSSGTAPNRVQVGPVTLDVEAHRAFVDGLELELTALEFRILGLLLQRHGRVQSRAGLLAEVGRDLEVSERAVDTHVKRLRAKLGPAAQWLETVRGVGYRFRDPDGRPAAADGT